MHLTSVSFKSTFAVAAVCSTLLMMMMMKSKATTGKSTGKTTKVKRELRTFQDLTRFVFLFYSTIGENIYSERDKNPWRRYGMRIFLIIGFFNFNFFVFGEILYFYIHITSTSTLLEATAVAPCIGFSMMADCKQFSLTTNRKILANLLDNLEELFPQTIELQQKYRVKFYEKNMNRVMTIFTILCMAYTSSFSFYPAIRSTFRYYVFHLDKFEQHFGFLFWFPFTINPNITAYWIAYWALAYCAYVAGVSYVCVDLLLILSITQLCMHFNYIADQLEEYDASAHTDTENIEFLHGLVKHHTRVLELSESVNDIFNFSILWNFIAASFVICFAGFQITAANVEDIILYFIFFTASLVQVFIVCYYGDELISSSIRIGDAAFNHNWLNSNSDYKYIMRIIMLRSQKPASIRPPTFPPISFRTFMKVISMSYQFFALLRTTYEDF